MTKKTENRGGARPGAGRPRKKKTTSEKVKFNWLAAARKIKKETGITIEEHALRMAIDPNVQAAVRASVFKTYNEALIVRESIQDVNVTTVEGPAIGLPPQRADLALTNRHVVNST